MKREGPQKVIKASANISVTFKLKIQVRVFFNKKNKWNQDVKLNFENFEFWTVPISKFALFRVIVYQFYNLKLKIYMVFTEKFEFCFQIFIT